MQTGLVKENCNKWRILKVSALRGIERKFDASYLGGDGVRVRFEATEGAGVSTTRRVVVLGGGLKLTGAELGTAKDGPVAALGIDEKFPGAALGAEEEDEGSAGKKSPGGDVCTGGGAFCTGGDRLRDFDLDLGR